MIWFVLICLLSGLLGGMGMGGGTAFIPLVTQAFGVEQHLAQWLNLVAFVPMALISLIIHAKNKLLDGKSFWLLVVPAVITAAISGWFSPRVKSRTLTVCYGVFLILLGIVFTVTTVAKMIRDKRKNTPREPPDEIETILSRYKENS